MVTRIKVCGLTRLEDVEALVQLNVHAIGLVFYRPSPRYVTPVQAAKLMQAMGPFITTVGLFVNATVAEVEQVLAIAPVALLQFHGDETPEQCHAIAQQVRRPFIRALRVQATMNADDLVQYEKNYRAASPWFSALLLDTFADSFGGSGKVFDWSIIPNELAPRVVLSGGLTVHNVSGAVTELRPMAVDISSGVEKAKGVKDAAMMQAFVQAVQSVEFPLSENNHDFPA